MQGITFSATALSIGVSAALAALLGIFYKQKYEVQNVKLVQSALINGFVTRLLLQVAEKQKSHNTIPIIVKETKEFFQFKAVELYEIKSGELLALINERQSSEIRGFLSKNWDSVLNASKHDTYQSVNTNSQGGKLYVVPIKAINKSLLLCMQETNQYPILRADLEVITKTLKYILNLANTINSIRLHGQPS